MNYRKSGNEWTGPHGDSVTDRYFFDTDDEDNEKSRRKKAEFMRRCLQAGVTDKQKICLVMYYAEGKTMQEIADELGINNSTVCRHIKSGRKKLEHLTYIAFGEGRIG